MSKGVLDPKLINGSPTLIGYEGGGQISFSLYDKYLETHTFGWGDGRLVKITHGTRPRRGGGGYTFQNYEKTSKK